MLVKQNESKTIYPTYTYKEQTNLDKICQMYGVAYEKMVVNDSKKRLRIGFFKDNGYLFIIYRDLPTIYSGSLDDLLNEEEFLEDVENLLKEQTKLEYIIKNIAEELSPLENDGDEDDTHWQPRWLCSQDTPPSNDIWAWVTVKEYSYDRKFVFAFPCQYNKETGYWRYSAGNGSMCDFVLDGSQPSNYSHDGYVKYYMPIGYKPNSPEDDCVS